MFKKLILIVFAVSLCLITSAQAANIIIVSGSDANDAGLKSFLQSNGHTVDLRADNWKDLDETKVAELEAADLIIASPTTNSADYAEDGSVGGKSEGEVWSSITTPILCLDTGLAQSSRWGWVSTTRTDTFDETPLLHVTEPSNRIFEGVTLDPNDEVSVVDSGEFITNRTTNMYSGTLLATAHEGSRTNVVIAEWAPTGEAFYTGGWGSVVHYVPEGPRILYTAVADSGPVLDIVSDAGKTILLNIVGYLSVYDSLSSNPKPGNGDDDLLLDPIILSWTPGVGAVTHDVYFSTDINDVIGATSTDPLGSLFSIGQDANSFDPNMLAYGATYYWRVDESDGATTAKGNIWSFSMEPLSDTLGTSHVTATASVNAYAGLGSDQDPNATCNGDGLSNSTGTHSTDQPDMYLCVSMGVPGDMWIQYKFDDIYNIYDMLIWNYNEAYPNSEYGAKDVNIAYSLDGETWTDLGSTFTLAKAPGDDTCTAGDPIVLGGKAAQYVKIIFQNGWADPGLAGISEVRFSILPMVASQFSPANNASNVAVDPTLTWRRGRGVIEHKVYFSTDEDAVTNRTVEPEKVTVSSYGPLSLTLNSTYYWCVDEVNSLAEYTTWPSSVLHFSTADSVPIEDFERYNSTPPNMVFVTWIDGSPETGVPANGGSQMGLNDEANGTFCETTIVHGGDQSGPLYYNNTASTFSQAVAQTANLPIGSNWNKGGADALVIWFRGTETNAATDQIYAKVGNNPQVVYDGPASDISRTAWTRWEIPLTGMDLNNVPSITIGVKRIGGSGGSGLIYLDDIELVIGVVAVEPASGHLVASYQMENNVNDSSGNNLNGTTTGDPVYAAGRSGMALVLDGSDDYAELPIGNLVSTLTDCTISTWVNWTPGETSMWSRIFDFGTGTSTNWFLSPYANNNRIRAAIKLSDSVGEQQADGADGDNGILEANNWQHLTVVINTADDPNTMKLYLNGNLIGTRNNLTTLPMDLGVTNQNYLGKSQWPDPAFQGMIDDFRIYDTAMTAGEVKYLYEN